MSRMKKIAFQVGLVAMLALLGAATAQAQTFPLADSPYHCSWERYNTSNVLLGKGVSLVTFQNVGYPDPSYIQAGTLFTVYWNASTLTKSYEVRMHTVTGQLYYYQPNATNPELTCLLYTSAGANTVQWNCFPNAQGVKVQQWCSQP
jgi:hypothetical protein